MGFVTNIKSVSQAQIKGYYAKDDYYFSEHKKLEVYGAGVEHFKLDGGITPEEIKKITGNRDKAAMDITISATKSVSLERALGHPEVSEFIDQAWKEANVATINFIQKSGLVNYKYKIDGETRASKAENALFAMVPHEVNRNLEPQRHEHVLIINNGTDGFGINRALDFKSLMDNQDIIGRFHMSSFLTKLEEAGFKLRYKEIIDKKGVSHTAVELYHITDSQIASFSTRRQEVLAKEKELIESNQYPNATPDQINQIAAVSTRKNKSKYNIDEVKKGWESLSHEIGLNQLETMPSIEIAKDFGINNHKYFRNLLTDLEDKEISFTKLIQENCSTIPDYDDLRGFIVSMQDDFLSNLNLKAENILTYISRKSYQDNMPISNAAIKDFKMLMCYERAKKNLVENEGVFTEYKLLSEVQKLALSKHVIINLDDFRKMLHLDSKLFNLSSTDNDLNKRHLASKFFLESEEYCLKEMLDGKGSRASVVEDAKDLLDAFNIKLKAEKNYTLEHEQYSAARMILESKDLICVVQGYAGTGKTTLQQAVKSICDEKGVNVFGVAPSAKAGQVLESETGIKSTTLESFWMTIEKYENFLKNKRDRDDLKGDLGRDLPPSIQLKYKIKNMVQDALTGKKRLDYKEVEKYIESLKNSMIVLDEASMCSTYNMRKIIEIANRYNMKISGCGDRNQFPSVASGQPMVDFLENGVLHSVLTKIRRQFDKNRANDDQSLLEIANILAKDFDGTNVKSAVEKLIALQEHELSQAIKPEELRAKVSEIAVKRDRLLALCKEHIDDILDGRHSIIITSTNSRRNQINNEIRFRLQKNNLIGSNDYEVMVKDHKNKLVSRKFSINDKIIFLENDTKHLCNSTSKVLNNETGVVTDIKTDNNGFVKQIVVQVDSLEPGKPGRVVKFDPRKYMKFDHGYSLTAEKSQGITTNKVIAELTSDKSNLYNKIYVALSRHKGQVSMYVDNIEQLGVAGSTLQEKKSARKLIHQLKEIADKKAEAESLMKSYHPMVRALIEAETTLWVKQAEIKHEAGLLDTVDKQKAFAREANEKARKAFRDELVELAKSHKLSKVYVMDCIHYMDKLKNDYFRERKEGVKSDKVDFKVKANEYERLMEVDKTRPLILIEIREAQLAWRDANIELNLERRKIESEFAAKGEEPSWEFKKEFSNRHKSLFSEFEHKVDKIISTFTENEEISDAIRMALKQLKEREKEIKTETHEVSKAHKVKNFYALPDEEQEKIVAKHRENEELFDSKLQEIERWIAADKAGAKADADRSRQALASAPSLVERPSVSSESALVQDVLMAEASYKERIREINAERQKAIKVAGKNGIDKPQEKAFKEKYNQTREVLKAELRKISDRHGRSIEFSDDCEQFFRLEAKATQQYRKEGFAKLTKEQRYEMQIVRIRSLEQLEAIDKSRPLILSDFRRAQREWKEANQAISSEKKVLFAELESKGIDPSTDAELLKSYSDRHKSEMKKFQVNIERIIQKHTDNSEIANKIREAISDLKSRESEIKNETREIIKKLDTDYYKLPKDIRDGIVEKHRQNEEAFEARLNALEAWITAEKEGNLQAMEEAKSSLAQAPDLLKVEIKTDNSLIKEVIAAEAVHRQEVAKIAQAQKATSSEARASTEQERMFRERYVQERARFQDALSEIALKYGLSSEYARECAVSLDELHKIRRTQPQSSRHSLETQMQIKLSKLESVEATERIKSQATKEILSAESEHRRKLRDVGLAKKEAIASAGTEGLSRDQENQFKRLYAEENKRHAASIQEIADRNGLSKEYAKECLQYLKSNPRDDYAMNREAANEQRIASLNSLEVKDRAKPKVLFEVKEIQAQWNRSRDLLIKERNIKLEEMKVQGERPTDEFWQDFEDKSFELNKKLISDTERAVSKYNQPEEFSNEIKTSIKEYAEKHQAIQEERKDLAFKHRGFANAPREEQERIKAESVKNEEGLFTKLKGTEERIIQYEKAKLEGLKSDFKNSNREFQAAVREVNQKWPGGQAQHGNDPAFVAAETRVKELKNKRDQLQEVLGVGQARKLIKAEQQAEREAKRQARQAQKAALMEEKANTRKKAQAISGAGKKSETKEKVEAPEQEQPFKVEIPQREVLKQAKEERRSLEEKGKEEKRILAEINSVKRYCGKVSKEMICITPRQDAAEIQRNASVKTFSAKDFIKQVDHDELCCSRTRIRSITQYDPRDSSGLIDNLRGKVLYIDKPESMTKDETKKLGKIIKDYKLEVVVNESKNKQKEQEKRKDESLSKYAQNYVASEAKSKIKYSAARAVGPEAVALLETYGKVQSIRNFVRTVRHGIKKGMADLKGEAEAQKPKSLKELVEANRSQKASGKAVEGLKGVAESSVAKNVEKTLVSTLKTVSTVQQLKAGLEAAKDIVEKVVGTKTQTQTHKVTRSI